MQRFFITSTGTGIGKTLVTASLCWQLRQSGFQVAALKPVISGYDAHDHSNDSAQILTACGIDPKATQQARISPWRYHAALAPNMAAAREGNPIDFNELIAFCNNTSADYLLVEGVGGVMAPITDRHTVLHWMIALKWQVILTAGTYLGAISHTLSAIETLKNKSLRVHALIVSESEASTVTMDETVGTLEKFLTPDIIVVKIPRLATTESVWKETPSISWLCQHPKKPPLA